MKRKSTTAEKSSRLMQSTHFCKTNDYSLRDWFTVIHTIYVLKNKKINKHLFVMMSFRYKKSNIKMKNKKKDDNIRTKGGSLAVEKSIHSQALEDGNINRGVPDTISIQVGQRKIGIHRRSVEITKTCGWQKNMHIGRKETRVNSIGSNVRSENGWWNTE